MKKKLTRKELIHRTDRLRQVYARYDGAKKGGKEWYNRCVTCGKLLNVKKLQGGHFIPRGCYPLRWDERNVNSQCSRCNGFLNGAYISYSRWFIDKYGEDMFRHYTNIFELHKRGQTKPLTTAEIREEYNKWLGKGRELEKKVGPLFPKTWEKDLDFME